MGFRPGGRARPVPGARTGRGGMLPQSGRWRTIGLLILVLVLATLLLHRHSNACSKVPPGGPNASNAGFWVAAAVASVPCPSTGRAVYGLSDQSHESMVGLDPVSDPSGGYLAVYAPAAAGGSAGSQIELGHSTDLTTWTRVRTLASGSGSPALEPVPGGGYLLAFQAGERIELRYYRSLSALLAARQAASTELPLRLSSSQNGGPSFRSVAWNGGLRHSELTLAFTYVTGGLERTGVGVVRDFRSWTAQPDTALDQGLDRRGLSGDHGQQRQFTIDGRTWRILAAQDLGESRSGGVAGWQIGLQAVNGGQVYAIKLGTVSGALATSFGHPVARVLPAPGGGQALVVSVYVFGSGPARADAGELLYWNPIGA